MLVRLDSPFDWVALHHSLPTPRLVGSQLLLKTRVSQVHRRKTNISQTKAYTSAIKAPALESGHAAKSCNMARVNSGWFLPKCSRPLTPPKNLNTRIEPVFLDKAAPTWKAW
jgi:hypothetical protein